MSIRHRLIVVVPVLAVLLAAVSALAQSADKLVLAPLYDLVGTNPDGTSYSGKLSIEMLSNTTVAMRWEIGGASYSGFGMRRNDILAATYTSDGQPGLVIYQVMPNGVLEGLWAGRGQAGNGTERLVPRR